ncbi:MAG: N-acetylmuramoyl-L-alanine amidase [Pseudomonadota bacterium]|nr:N-acetylmuramoyl-L-alanine amidase [Pseudomonadota bacterium]
MRVKGITLQQLLLGAALLAALSWNLAQANEIKGLQLDSGATGTRAEIALESDPEFELISLAGPDRLVVDLPDVRLGKTFRLPAATGVIKAVRTGHPAPGVTRIVFDLAAPVSVLKPRLEPSAKGSVLVLEWPGDGVDTGNARTAVVPAAVSSPPAVAEQPIVEPDTNPVDPSIASREATSRLISNVAPAPTKPPMAPPPTTGVPSLQSPVPTTSELPGVIATGVPTRIATGVPSTAVPSTVVPESAQQSTQTPVKTMQDVMRRGGLRPLIIAIDAGHGGQDPGARGAAGSREKDLTLKIARELARQVNATAGLKAYLTRDTDVFIALDQRYKKARAAKADLFVSIHADAFTNPAAHGSSVFVLSQRGASSQAARWLASQENSADLVGGVRLRDRENTLASVLLDLSQSATMKASEDMANHVLQGLKGLGKTHKPHVERANFVVLRSPDVPSMLVETAFITNPDEERRLNDPVHQARLARAILDGVNTYFTRQPPPGTLYSARADARVAASAGGGSP